MRWIPMALLAALAVSGPAMAAAKTNLISIVTDDQGRWAMGLYGNREIHTPHMDRIGREGGLFTRALVNTPVCSPSRATWLTGLYPTQHGINDWINPAQAEAGRGVGGHLTWARVLQQAGYRTALIGKWHLGTSAESHPTKTGFDHFYGFLAGGNRPIDPILEVNGTETQLKGSLPDLLVDESIRWIEANRNAPFALSLHFRAPHSPYGPVPEEDSSLYRDLDPTIPDEPGLDEAKIKQSTREYYASVTSVDRNVGRLLEALDRLKLTDNTLVIFTSDHGYNLGRHSISTKGNGQWLAGGVSGPPRPNMWDTSVLVPMVVRWPGVIKPGSTFDQMFSAVDMFRTVLGALQVPMPADAKAMGTDFSPLLRGQPMPAVEAVFGQYDLRNSGLAYMRMIRTDRYKLIRYWHSEVHEMYDLLEDPDEKWNMLRSGGPRARGKGPQVDPAVLQDLDRRLRAWMASINDPLLNDPY